MRHITVTFANGETMDTNINGTNEAIEQYYIGNSFDLGLYPVEDMQEAVSVKFHDKEV